jgi:tripartite-type tricarboxylate transporter receptor subunit TctC
MTHRANDARAAQRRRILHAGAIGIAAVAALSVTRWAHAAHDPGVRILCSGPAGSTPDLVARAIAEQLPAALGRHAVIDNRPGAAGQLSVAALTNAPADGSTLLLAQGAIATVNPFLYAKPGYDAARDLQPVSLAAETALGLGVGPAVPEDVATLADFIAWLRLHPNAANVGSPGTGTLPHLLEAMLFQSAGLEWQHIAYSGGPPAVNHLLGGQTAALVLPEGLLRQHHTARRIRVLATSGPTRSDYLPEVPSFVEQGHPNLVVKEWFAFFAPGGTPKSTVATLSAALQQAIAHPAVRAAFAEAGMTPASSSAPMLVARIAAEQRYWQPVLRATRIHAD